MLSEGHSPLGLVVLALLNEVGSCPPGGSLRVVLLLSVPSWPPILLLLQKLQESLQGCEAVKAPPCSLLVYVASGLGDDQRI